MTRPTYAIGRVVQDQDDTWLHVPATAWHTGYHNYSTRQEAQDAADNKPLLEGGEPWVVRKVIPYGRFFFHIVDDMEDGTTQTPTSTPATP